MDQDDKLDIILKKLKETEDKVKELEQKNAKQEKIIKKEEASVAKALGGGHEPFMSRNRILILAAVVVVAVALAVLFSLNLPPFSYFVTSNTSARFFNPSDGSLMGPSYISGLSNLSIQLAEVGYAQVDANLNSTFISNIIGQGFTQVGNTSVFCLPASAGSSSSSSYPGYCIFFMGDQNYNIIPLQVNGSFTTLSSGGKPTFLYLGASGCPYCAAMRWSIAVALSRFGTFTKLFYDWSATNDANVPTLMFNFSKAAFNSVTSKPPVNGAPYGDSNPTPFVTGAYYSSQYINFQPIDQLGTSFLTNSTGIEGLLGTNFKIPASSGFNISDMAVFPNYGVPFFDINNQFVFDGAIVNINPIFSSSGTLLSQYNTQAGILSSIQNPTVDSFGETVLGGANILTAQICDTINNTAPVCGLPYITSLEALVNSH